MHAADVDGRDMAYRVVGDHIRTLTFAITDGAVPSNEGRGYVLRRILRRAVRYAKQFLKAKPGFFAGLVPTVVQVFSPAFPELAAKAAFVADIIREEEESFVRTLSKGIKTFEKRAEELKAAGEAVIPGRDAFFLYDSMGFPLDLTALMAAEQGLSVDTAGFEAAMAEQKARSQASQKFARGGLSLKLEAEQTSWLAKSAGAAPTVDAAKYVWHEDCDSSVVAVYLGKDKDVCAGFLPPGTALAVREGEEEVVGLVLAATSFYAESGGQVGDTGLITSPPDAASPWSFQVLDSQVYGGFVVHVGTLASGSFAVGAPARASVDYERRSRIGPNHTMTHVLNWALREVCGEGCDQRGSNVAADKLRFDYAVSKAPTAEQLGRIEALVSAAIERALPVHTAIVPLAAAMEIAGLRAVFGEVYPVPVRVVSVGEPVDALLAGPKEAARWRGVSIECCGGTHIANTSRAGAFALLSDEALAKGVRRLTRETRGEAQAAHSRGAELRTAVTSARALSGAALNAAIVTLKHDLDAAELSAATKAELRDMHSGLCKAALEEEKAAAGALAEAGRAGALAACAAAAAGGARAAVWDASVLRGDGKASVAAMEAARKAHPGLALLGVSSDGVDKVLVFSCSPKAGEGAVLAKEWVTAVLAVGGGTGGGKHEQAQGTSKEMGAEAAMLEAARGFVAGP
jgi:alanyl-tRNA synthetase